MWWGSWVSVFQTLDQLRREKNPTALSGPWVLGVILNQLRKISTAPRPTALATAKILAVKSWEFIRRKVFKPWDWKTQALL